MQLTWLVCALALIARSRANSEAVQLMRCFACGAGGSDSSACAPAAGPGAGAFGAPGQTVICPRDSPHCATRATSPNFISALACSAVIEGVCVLNYSVKGTYEMICTCSTPLCNAPFSDQMQTELINFTTLNSVNNDTQLNEQFWKQSHLAYGSDANMYNKITEKIKGVTEAPVRISSEWKDIKSVPASTEIPGDEPRDRVVHTEMPRAEADHQTEAPLVQVVRQVDKLRLQMEAQKVLFKQQAERPHAQALQQRTAAPSEDDEDEGEGSGTDEESPGRRAPATAPAVPDSFLPADENCAPPLSVNVITISSLFLYSIM